MPDNSTPTPTTENHPDGADDEVVSSASEDGEISKDSTLERASDTQQLESSTDHQRSNRVDRALRVVFLVVLGVGLFTGYALKPSLNRDMRQFLKGSDVQIVEEVEPEIELPFLPWEGRILSVWHHTTMPGRSDSLALRSYFSRDGEYRGTQTQKLPALGARRPVGDLEVAMRRAGEHYFEPHNATSGMELSRIMENLSRNIDTSRLLGFVLFPVRYSNKEGTSSEDAVPSVVVHLWCKSDSSEHSTAEHRKPCPEAARIVYSLQSQSIVQNDELL